MKEKLSYVDVTSMKIGYILGDYNMLDYVNLSCVQL